VAIRTGLIQESHQIGKFIGHWLLRNPDVGKKNCRASGLLEQALPVERKKPRPLKGGDKRRSAPLIGPGDFISQIVGATRRLSAQWSGKNLRITSSAENLPLISRPVRQSEKPITQTIKEVMTCQRFSATRVN